MNGSPNAVSRFLRAPLLHFLILGLLLFGLYSRYGEKGETVTKEIVVSS